MCGPGWRMWCTCREGSTRNPIDSSSSGHACSARRLDVPWRRRSRRGGSTASGRSVADDVTRGKVAVLGAGLMGAEIAALFLRAGHVVTITVSARTSAEAARERVEAGLSGHDGRVLVAASAAEASLDADLV